MVKSFSKENLNVQHLQWIKKSSVPIFYNEYYQSCFDLNSSETTKAKSVAESSKFECVLSKYKLDFEQSLDDEHVLLVLSRNYGLLMVDFSGEGIIQLEIGKPKDHITAFNVLITESIPSKIETENIDLEGQAGSEPGEENNKQSQISVRALTCVGSKSGKVKFIYSDSEFETQEYDKKETYHQSNVSCIQFCRHENSEVFKCATGSYDRYIYLWKICNFGKADFDAQKDIKLFTKMKYDTLKKSLKPLGTNTESWISSSAR